MVNPPMASAMDVGLSVERANESAAIMAAHQREHFLGYINPVGQQQTPPDQIPPSGQVIPPSAYANPESTVNASISSEPNPVITSGTGGDGVFLAAPATTATPTTAAATIAGTTNVSTLTPTLAAAVTPTPTQAANPRLGTQSSTPASTTTTTTASATVASSRAVASSPVIVPIRVVTGANGAVMVTNVSSTPMVNKGK